MQLFNSYIEILWHSVQFSWQYGNYSNFISKMFGCGIHYVLDSEFSILWGTMNAIRRTSIHPTPEFVFRWIDWLTIHCRISNGRLRFLHSHVVRTTEPELLETDKKYHQLNFIKWHAAFIIMKANFSKLTNYIMIICITWPRSVMSIMQNMYIYDIKHTNCRHIAHKITYIP